MSTAVPPDDPRRVRPGHGRQRDPPANRRTFLAGIPTAMTLYTFGFTIAKFAMYLDQERPTGFPSAIVEGERGVVIVDPLVSAETAAAEAS